MFSEKPRKASATNKRETSEVRRRGCERRDGSKSDAQEPVCGPCGEDSTKRNGPAHNMGLTLSILGVSRIPEGDGRDVKVHVGCIVASIGRHPVTVNDGSRTDRKSASTADVGFRPGLLERVSAGQICPLSVLLRWPSKA